MDGLRNAGIVVTRPSERGQSLCRLVASEGGRALSFPTLEIRPLDEARVSLPAGPVDWLIFTSVNAVTYGMDVLRDYRGDATRIAAVGDATAAALDEEGWNTDLLPRERQESEGLLESEALQSIAGKRILIVKGEGGRELLRDSLAERGAEVGVAAVYRREKPDSEIQPLLDWWRKDGLDAIVVSSRAGLENLHALLDEEGRKYLASTTLVAPTVRMIKLIRELGITAEPVIASGASDVATMTALLDWWRETQDRRQQDSE
ncbi:MAG: uroporphyrinogen-III synthase [Gammaproteobacteria bacterium]|nr:uroporphyrinogen-III synthase [Gammaproteobacteria bacterium]